MNQTEILAFYDQDQRRALRLPGMVYEQTGRILRDISPAEGCGFIDYADLDEQTADAEIDSQLADFRRRNLPFLWKVFDHDRPADLRDRLAARGFTLDDPDALMVLDLSQAPDSFRTVHPHLPVQDVTSPDGIEGIARLEEQVWQGPRDWLRKRLLQMLETDPESLRLYAVLDGERVLSAGWIYYYPGSAFARLAGGATLPEARGRGCYSAVLADRVRSARQRGVRFLTVDASPMSRPILESFGFQCIGFSTIARWAPPVDPA